MKLKTFGFIIGGVMLAWVARALLTGSPRFGFLVPNIVLAMVPLLIETPLKQMYTKPAGWIKYGALALLGAIWLLFLPNAFYILTDFMHLNGDVLINARYDQYTYRVPYVRGDGLYLYDSLLIFSLTALGAYLGGRALWHLYRWLQTVTTKWYAWMAVGSVMLLSGLGVYIGRFSRWNSWEALVRPQGIITDLVHDLMRSASRERMAWTVGVVMIFELGSLLYARWASKKHE